MRDDDPRPYDLPVSKPSFIAEAAARYGMPRDRLQRAVQAVLRLIPEELVLLEELSALEELDLEYRRRLAQGLRGTIESYRRGDATEDPLAAVDDPMDFEEGVEATAWAELEAGKNRARLLRQSVGAEEAGDLTGRSRQAVERQRREGRVVALRAGRRWRYPAWQFDADGPGGLVPGLPEVLAQLHLSPAGTAHWLTTSRPELGGKPPIKLLRRRDKEPVLRLAEQLGHLP